MNNSPVNFFSDYGNNFSSPLVRTETSASSNSHILVNNHYAPVIINVFDSFKSERFSSASLKRENLFDESSFDTLLFYDNARSDSVISFVLVSSVAIRNSVFHASTSLEAEAATLNWEEA